MMTMKSRCAKYSYLLFVMLIDISEGVVCSYSSLSPLGKRATVTVCSQL